MIGGTSGESPVELPGRGFAWLDTGTHDSLIDAGRFVRTIERRQGLKIACIGELTCRKGFIGRGQLEALVNPLAKNACGEYLLRVAASG